MYEELIRRLREDPLDSNKAALPIMDLCIDAATAIENLSHMIILMFVPVCVIGLFRCVVIPVELKRVNELRKNGMKDFHLFGSFYFCHDKDARSIANRNFFFRIKEDDHA